MTVIQNKTIINKKDISKFLMGVSIQKSWLIVICAVVIALLGFSFENGVLIYKNYLFIVAAVCTLVIYIISTFITVSKSTKTFKEITNEFSFNDDELKVVGSTDGTTEKFDIKYHQLYRVKETKEYFYLFVNKYSALIVKKNDDSFSQGDALKLKKFLELKLTAVQNQLKKQNKAKWLLYFFIFSKILE